ncbi:response regulator [Opitutaceae bacterium TAV4]|nr:response regulator [Opitutaceae bacterium TAV4]RRJ99103.1 response regulator [Opitutaceae bacterium TAV3]RRK00308.1 response regulator [Opitutaceae bacterium TAV3]
MMLRAIVVDDERLARKRLRELLSHHPEISVVDEAADAASAIAAVTTWRPDVLFLDMELSPGNGLQLLPQLPVRPIVVFVTAYETFAVQAFEVCAFDYLLKPVHPDRLAQTVRRLLQDAPPSPPHSAPPFALSPSPLTLQDRIPLKDSRTVTLAKLGRIAAIKAAGAYSRVMLCDHPPMTVLRSISEWERTLPARAFMRIDRSLILQLPLVRAIKTISRDECLLTLDGLPSPLTIGRAASRRLRRDAQALFGNGDVCIG